MAVHLEVVTDISTDSFLLCFQRFAKLRRCPQIVQCDNTMIFDDLQRKIEIKRAQSSNSHQGANANFCSYRLELHSPTFTTVGSAQLMAEKQTVLVGVKEMPSGSSSSRTSNRAILSSSPRTTLLCGSGSPSGSWQEF